MNRLHRFTRPVYRVFLTCTLLATPLFAQTFSTLYSFDGVDNNAPDSALIQATDGNLYGTTVYGGPAGQGSVYKITPGGTLTTLYNFCSLSGCPDGTQPLAPVVQGFDGNLYGTTYYGGGSSACNSGCGTVFKITAGGILTTLHSFAPGDGTQPQGGLTLAADGDFYGATLYGTLYKITPGGTFTVLHTFTNGDDGSMPYSSPIQASDGNFYGVTYDGGTWGNGVVYRLHGTTLTTLYSFCSVGGCADGAYPLGALVQAADGKLYGTTALGGNTGCDLGYGCGTVFSITLGGALTTLYTFHEPAAYTPLAALVQGPDGALYGTTQNGGFANCTHGCGTLFRITTRGTYNHLYSFCSVTGCPDGELPQAGPLLLNTDGTFYGTTPEGGASGVGTIFTYSVGFPALAKSSPVAGAAGTTVRILGTDLTGATSVTFNGTSAAFTVVSASEITTTVPAGATSGRIQVVTPGGTLSTIPAFYVLP